jgi:hypothetical protein
VTCPFGHDDGAYVLGALSPVERLEFERHLAGCAECTRAVRELAGLPGLLGRVGRGVLEEPLDEPLPDSVLPALSREVRRARRRRTVVASGLAAAVAAVVVPVGASQLSVLGFAPDSPTPSANPSGVVAQPMDPVGEVPVRASVTMEQVTWGTRLGLTCTYDPESVEYELPPVVDYLLFVRTHDGRAERVGSWESHGGKTMQLPAATAAKAADIASVEVRTTDGRVVLELAT